MPLRVSMTGASVIARSTALLEGRAILLGLGQIPRGVFRITLLHRLGETAQALAVPGVDVRIPFPFAVAPSAVGDMRGRMQSRRPEILPVRNVFHVERPLPDDPLSRRLHSPLVLLEPLAVAGQEIVLGQIVENSSRSAVVNEFVGEMTGNIGERRVVKQLADAEIARSVGEIAVGQGARSLQEAVQPHGCRLVKSRQIHVVDRSRRFQREVHVAEFPFPQLRCPQSPSVLPARFGHLDLHRRIFRRLARRPRGVGRKQRQLDLPHRLVPRRLAMCAGQLANAFDVRGLEFPQELPCRTGLGWPSGHRRQIRLLRTELEERPHTGVAQRVGARVACGKMIHHVLGQIPLYELDHRLR